GSERLDTTRLGRKRCSAGERKLAGARCFGGALESAKPDAPRDDTRGHGSDPRSIRQLGEDGSRHWFRLARTALRARLSDVVVHYADHQSAHRRIWWDAREPHALPAGSLSRRAKSLAGRKARIRAYFGARLGCPRGRAAAGRRRNRAVAERGR